MSTVRNRKGFTLIEVIVVAGIIAILAGILVPMIFSQIDEAKITRAQGDLKTIQTSIMAFRKDTGVWPNKAVAPATPFTLLYSDSTSTAVPPIPHISGPNWVLTAPDRMVNHLESDNNAVYGTVWKGPYLAGVGADPWGNAYVINADQFDTADRLWIVSAGPDGDITTNPFSSACSDKNASPVGDDICLRLK